MLKEESEMIEAEVLMRYIRIFSELSNQVKYSSQKRILIEIALIKLCKPAMENTQDSLTDRIARLEQRMEQGIPVAAVSAETAPHTAAQPVKKPELPKAVPEDVEQIVRNWRTILQDMPGLARTYLKKAHLSLGGDNRLMLVFDEELDADAIREEQRKQEIEKIISERIDRKVEVSVQLNESERPFEESYVDLEQIINMDVTIEDE